MHKENQGPEKLSDFPRLAQQEAEMGSYLFSTKLKGSSAESHPPFVLFIGPSPSGLTASVGVQPPGL